MRYDIFISYSRQDGDRVRPLVDELLRPLADQARSQKTHPGASHNAVFVVSEPWARIRVAVLDVRNLTSHL
jgi:hypothetical protein